VVVVVLRLLVQLMAVMVRLLGEVLVAPPVLAVVWRLLCGLWFRVDVSALGM
jgi:hypothetical protein